MRTLPALLFVCCLPSVLWAEPALDPNGISGTLVIAGQGAPPDIVLDRFAERAGGTKGRLVVVAADKEKANLDRWKDRKLESVELLALPASKETDDGKLLAPLRAATAVWIEGGNSAALQKELEAVLKRGGVVGGDVSAFGLVPGAVIDTGTGDTRQRLLASLAKTPGCFGVAVGERTALVVTGRSLRVLGDGSVALCLAAGAGRAVRTEELKGRAEADLTAWRRSALARTQPAFPPQKAAVPEVPKGTLVIVGGGGTPPDALKTFIESAGGPEGLIVVLPTAMPDPLPRQVGEVAMLERAGAKNVKLLPARARKDVEAEASLDLLSKARGLWFSGGRQWRFIDSYEGTKAVPLFFDVLKRGGVIGGSSAGASIQSEYMPRGSPLGNLEMMCEGYDRGLGFLPGAAVDQHFSQRRRFDDMTALMKRHPQLLGIGLDETTAIVVRGTVAEVMGRNKAHFYDYLTPPAKGEPDYTALTAGQRYDLKDRKVLEK